jgi:hypothetical protein
MSVTTTISLTESESNEPLSEKEKDLGIKILEEENRLLRRLLNLEPRYAGE